MENKIEQTNRGAISQTKKDAFFNRVLEYFMYLFVFILPWQTRWIINDNITETDKIFEYGRMSLYAFDILLIVMLVVFLFAKSIRVRFNIAISKAEAIGFGLCVILFAVMAYSIYFFAFNTEIAYYFLIRFVLAFGLFVLVWKVRFSIVKMMLVLSLAACIQSFLAVWQVAVKKVFASKWLGMALHESNGFTGESVVQYGNERLLRAYGSLPHPNILAGFLVVSFCLVVYLMLKAEKRYQIVYLFFVFSLILTGIFLTFSRVAWLLTFVAIIFLFSVFSRKATFRAREISRILGTLSLVVLAVLTIIFWQPVKTRFQNNERLERKSSQERFDSTRNAINIIKNNWPVGVGLGNYTYEVRRLDRNKHAVWSYAPVHNVYLLAWAELGIVGAVVILLFLMYFVARILASRDDQFIGYPLPILVMGSALGSIYLFMFFDHYFWTTAFGIYFWFFVFGLFVKNIGRQREEVVQKLQAGIDDKINSA